MDDLVVFLRAQLDEDERLAQRVEPDQAPNELRVMVTRDDSQPFLVIDSARVLREVEAKRRMVGILAAAVEPGATTYAGVAGVMLRILALPYSDRPGYRSVVGFIDENDHLEWRPDASP